MLDVSRAPGSLKAYQVLESFDWEFAGGKFGVRKDPVPKGAIAINETNGFELPMGTTRALSREMVRAASNADASSEDFDPPMIGPLKEIFDNRAAARAVKGKEIQAWTAIYAYASDEGRRIVAGMPAVYKAASEILAGAHYKRGALSSRAKHAKLRALVTELSVAGGIGAELSTTHTATNVSTAMAMMSTYRVPELSAAESQAKAILARAVGIRAGAAFADFAEELCDMPDLQTDDLDDVVDWDDMPRDTKAVLAVSVEIFPRCVVIRKPTRSYVLGLSDWRKVIIIVTGFRNYLVGCCADACVGSIPQIAAASRTVSAVYMTVRDAVNAGSRLGVGKHLEFAKMYKTLLSVVKARAAGARAEPHAAALFADLQATSTFAECKREVTDALSRISCLTSKGALVAAKVYRLMPPPDVWMADALRNRWEKASVEFNVAEPLLDEFDKALTEVILTSRCYDKSAKLELLDENNRPGWWGAYLMGKYDKVPKSQLVDYVKSRGTVTLASRSRYDPSVWKDSALGLDTFVLAMMDEVDPNLKNMLTRMLYDDKCPMPDQVSAVFEELSAVMLKPESHKERIAYMNNLSSRFRQSITEATVGRTMKSHPAFAPVKSGNERDLIFEDMSSPPPRTSDVPMHGKHLGDYWVTLFYSFDITGWSERMCANLQRRSHEVWDRMCGGSEFRDTEANHRRARVYMNNGGVKAWYTNGGANFEGYNGKEMTALHIAIMTVAVRKLRQKRQDVPPEMLKIVLQAYIDDGVCKMTLPSKIADSVFETWEVVVSETWAEYGFTIEPKKSYPSYYYFEFLGEEFYAGRQLASGSKAAMRITAEPFDYWETLPERTAKVAAACRGASACGTPSFGAVFMQSFFCSLEIARWIDIRDATAVAFWCLIPRATGGLGLPSLISQSTNAAGAAIEESMAMVHAWAVSGRNSAVTAAYVKMARRGFTARTSSEIMASPLGGQPGYGRMTVNPLARTVASGLRAKASAGDLSPLANVVVSMMDRESNEAFADACVQMAPGEVLQEALLRDLREGTLDPIASAFIKRFEKEGTFLALASRSKLMKEAREARADAKDSYETTRALVIPSLLTL